MSRARGGCKAAPVKVLTDRLRDVRRVPWGSAGMEPLSWLPPRDRATSGVALFATTHAGMGPDSLGSEVQ